MTEVIEGRTSDGRYGGMGIANEDGVSPRSCLMTLRTASHDDRGVLASRRDR